MVPMLPTTSLQSVHTGPSTYHVGGKHVVFEGAFDSLPSDGRYFQKVDVFFFDTPSTDPNTSHQDYFNWLMMQFVAMEKHRAPNVGLFLVPTEQKGSPWSKSAATVDIAFDYGWQLFRHFVWLKQDADFHRSQYAFQDVWALRKGNMPAQADSDVRYKDVVRIVSPIDKDSHIGMLNPKMVEHFLPLFARPGTTVMDPFAGRGSVMRACQALDLKSVSVELFPERARELRALADSFKEVS